MKSEGACQTHAGGIVLDITPGDPLKNSISGKQLRRSRLLLFVSSTLLFLVVGFWIHSFLGVGHLRYFPPMLGPNPGTLWVVAAESGSLTMAQVPPFGYPATNWDWGYVRFSKGGLAGDGGGWFSRLIGRFRCHSGSVEPDFYGNPCLWICSVPFWLLSTVLGMVAIVAVRRGRGSRS